MQEGSFLLTAQTVDKILEAAGMGPLKYNFDFIKDSIYNKLNFIINIYYYKLY